MVYFADRIWVTGQVGIFFARSPSVGAVSGGFLLSTALPKSSVSANFPPFFYLCSPFAS